MKQVTPSLSANPLRKEQSAALIPAARSAWTTSFTSQPAKDAPSVRLKARAELVRNALSSSQY